MTPLDRAKQAYRKLWCDNGTHSEAFVISGMNDDGDLADLLKEES